MTVADMVAIALRYRTAMSDALLRAAGVDRGAPAPRVVAAAQARARDPRFDGIGECFRNEHSPMDGRF